MIVFWTLIGIMLIAAILVVVWPLLKQTTAGPNAKDLNVLLYKQRLKELETDRDNGTLSADQFLNAHQELEQQLLLDVEGAKPGIGPPATTKPAWVTVVILALLLPVVSLGLYSRLGQWGVPTTGHEPAAHSAGGPAGQNDELLDLDEMITRLQTRLDQQPGDPAGWIMLGRSYAHIGRYNAASQAFAKAISQLEQLQEPTPPSLLLDYAHALAIANNDSYEGKPADLITAALEKEPDNLKGLWLAGMMYSQRGEPAKALQYWRPLQARIQPGSEDAKVLDSLIAQAAASLPDQAAQKPSTEIKPEPASAAADHQADAASEIKVSVTLDSNLGANANPQDTVFVYARAKTGPPMPLAIVRKQVQDLPFTVTLDDSQAMMPAMQLSKFPQVIIGARISKSGNALPQSGDLQGMTDTVHTGTDTNVSVVIDQVVP